MLYEPGARFGTLSSTGRARLFTVNDAGDPVEQPTTLHGLPGLETKENGP